MEQIIVNQLLAKERAEQQVSKWYLMDAIRLWIKALT